jgi:hydrogenase nickel incorporation protein HypA/HybF
MHEVSVVADLIAAIVEELKKYEVISVEEVTIVVGKLTNLGAEQMEFAYEIMSKDTILEGSKLVIEEEEIVLKCEACGYDGPAKVIDLGEEAHYKMPVLSCPECGGEVTITAGKSCCVKSAKIEEAD